MTTWSDRLALIVTADTKGAVAGLEAVGTTAERELTKAQTKLDATGRNLTRLGVGSIAAGAVIGAGLYKAAQAYDEANKASLQLENTIRNQPALAGANAKALEGLAQSIQHKTAADGDEIVAGMAKLGMYGANEAALRQLTPLVVDYARKTGKDMVSAFADVGKALNGQQRALKAAGVVIDDNAYATDRLSAITDGLRQSVGGFAEREGKTFSGQMQRLKNDAMDLAEGLGKGVTQALGDLTGGVDKATQGFGLLGEGAQASIGRFATYGAGLLIVSGGLEIIVGQAIKARAQIAAVGDALTTMRLKAMYASEGMTANFGATAAGAGILAGLVAQVTLAVQDFQREQARGTAAADQYRQALEGQGDATRNVNEATKELLGQSDELGNLAKTLTDAGVSMAPFQKAIKDNGKELDDLATAFQTAGLSSQQFLENVPADSPLTKALMEAYKSGRLTAEQTTDLILRLDELSDGYDKGAASVDKNKVAKEKAAAADKKAAAAAKELADAQAEALATEFSYGQATTDLANAREDAAQAQADAAQKVRDADRDIRDAERDVRDAHRDVADAVADVARAYEDARQQLKDYQDQVTEGGFSVREAQFSVADAQQALTEAQAKGDPTEISKAQLRLEEAQYRLQQANDRLTEAQADLNDATAKGLDQSPQVLEAQQRVKDAKDREKDATDRLTQAEKDRKTAVEEGAKAVEAANGKVLEALRKQQEQLLITIAAWRILQQEQAKNGGPNMPSERYYQGYAPGYTPPGANPPGNAPTGVRSAVGPKSGVTNINVYVDGVTQTTKSAIHQGIKKASKQAAISYYRRAA